MIAATVMTIVYLVYRALFTMNLASPYAVVASLTLYIAEFYGGLLMFLFFFQIWDLRNPAPVPPLAGRTVDVMIPTYNEDPTLLCGTINAALKIDYPHRTLVLDDGKRPEVKALCEELGAEYVTRPSNVHAKAGNLNHALEMTDGEFVVIFDADHVSERHFIDRLIGYFQDDRLGFVQTPHAFYNFDAYQGVLNYRRGVYWEEGMLFYNVTQPGKNRWNGVTFCGSAAMFRRKSLEEVGLIATQSITEDMHTGLRMHAKGWKSLFVNERLIAAIAADDVTSFNTQRLRWGEGNLGIFAFDNPLTIKGLTIAQRLCYLGSMLSWTTGIQKLLIYVTPIAMLLTEVAPVNKMTWQLLAITIVYLITIWTAVKVASNGYGRLLAIELTQMACFWTQIKSTWRAVFKRKRAKFVVTAKRGRQSNSIVKHLAPQIVLIVASTLAIAWALTRYCLLISNDLVSLLVGSALLMVNCYMAWIVIQRALRTKDRRSAWRHPVALHVDYQTIDDKGAAIVGQCVTRDINEGGVALVTFDQLPICQEMDLTFTVAGKSVICRGTVRHELEKVRLKGARGGSTQAFVYGVQFVDPTKEQLEGLWWLGAQFAVSLHYEKFRGGQFGLGPATLRQLPDHPDELPFEFPLRLRLGDGRTVCGVTVTLGAETFKILLPSDFPCDEPTQLELMTPFGPLEGSCEVIEDKSRVVAGLAVKEGRFRFKRFAGESRSLLHSNLGHAGSKELATVVRSAPRRRPADSLRPVALVAGTTGTAAIIAIGCVIHFQQEKATLAAAHAGHTITEVQVENLSELAHNLASEPNLDEWRVLQLRKVMLDMERSDEVAAIDNFFVDKTPTSWDGLSLKAGSLQRLHRESEAEPVFRDLLAHLNDLADDDMRREVLLAAARNAAALDDFPLSLARFEQLKELGAFTADAAREYAGVLFHVGRIDDAVRLLTQQKPNAQELLLLASIYSSEKQFSLASDTYRQVLQETPDDLQALRGLGDTSYWSQDFAAATDAYQAVLKQTPDDWKVRELLANVLLSQQRFDESLVMYTRLIDRFPEQTKLWEGFLIAAAGSVRIDVHQTRLLETIYQRTYRSNDDRFLTNLLNAVAKHGDASEAIVLLQHLVKQSPRDAELRLRLADALHQAGQYRAADIHYRWLIGNTPKLSMAGQHSEEVDDKR